jgi:hypothetical protein
VLAVVLLVAPVDSNDADDLWRPGCSWRVTLREAAGTDAAFLMPQDDGDPGSVHPTGAPPARTVPPPCKAPDRYPPRLRALSVLVLSVSTRETRSSRGGPWRRRRDGGERGRALRT